MEGIGQMERLLTTSRYLAIGSIDSPSVLMWDSFDDTLKTLEPAWFGGVTTLSWSPNGDYLFAGYTNDAASGSSSWKIWETMTWTVQGFLQDHGCKVRSPHHPFLTS